MTDLPWSSGEQAGSISNLQSLIAFSDNITKLVDERMCNLSESQQSSGCKIFTCKIKFNLAQTWSPAIWILKWLVECKHSVMRNGTTPNHGEVF